MGVNIMLETFNVFLFGKERKIRVYLPSNYVDMDKKYPVLYMHDGQNVFGNEEAIGGVSLQLHEYLGENNIEIIVVAIDQNPAGEERVNEYCPWKHGAFSERLLAKPASAGGKGKEYIDFIVNELKPLVDRKYPTIENQTSMAGISLGALITTYAACSYPHIFKRIAGMSSAFYRNQEEIEKLLKSSDLTPLEKVYLDCGTKEAADNNEISELFLQSNKAVFEIVKQQRVKTEINIIDGAHHNYNAFKKRVPELISSLV
jgi:predicted alpha/beta superfamily hydrolase